MINVVRNSKRYKEDFIKENDSLRKRRSVVGATKRLLNHQKKVLETQLQSIQLPGWMEDAANLQALETALERATPALLRPFDPLAGERDKAWWHKAARMIALEVRMALIRAERKTISFQKHGAAVEVVAAALRLAIGKEFDPTTVAEVLAKDPQLNPRELAG
jgi:hypothetical protein